MKKIFIIFLMTFSLVNAYSRTAEQLRGNDSVVVSIEVEFFTYDGPYGAMDNVKKPAVKFILTVENKGRKPIPDLDVSNRSTYVNLYINDSVNNPVSLYNGREVAGDHVIVKNDSDTYTWWFPYENGDGYGDEFTVQWQYMELFSKKIKVNMTNKTQMVLD